MTNSRETADMDESRIVLFSNLACLAAYLLPPNDTSLPEAEIAEMVNEEEYLQEPFRTRTLRRRLIQKIITINRVSLNAELFELSLWPRHVGQFRRIPLPRFRYDYPSSGSHLSLLQRLILVMRLREQYSVRKCSLLLKTSETVTEELFQHAISLL